MNISDIKLPSNQNFGAFFTCLLAVASGYFYLEGASVAFYVSSVCCLLFLLATIFKPGVLLFLNRLWMGFGLLLGMFVSPIVLGVIFFGLFTPLSLVMRLFGRDELRLRFKQKQSYWINRGVTDSQSHSFKNQF
ncbi:SxtJ family membrane protein [Pseudomonadales bacterium]|nr:SxtJ family membrane protein [Pseudomonadales bacterium]